MARPGTLPVWATNANYVGGPAIGTPTVVAPSSAAQQEGWEPGQEPGAQNQNWWQNLTYQWINWLAAGVLDGNWEFTGNVLVDGHITCVGGFYGATTGAAALIPQGATAAAGNIVASAGYVDGQQVYFESSRADIIPAADALVRNVHPEYDGSTGAFTSYAFSNTNPTTTNFGLTLPVGAVITGYTAMLNKTSNASQQIHMELLAVDVLTGAVTNPDTSNASGANTSANNPGFIFLSPSLLPSGSGLTVDSDHTYQILVDTNNALDDEDFIFGVIISWKFPHP